MKTLTLIALILSLTSCARKEEAAPLPAVAAARAPEPGVVEIPPGSLNRH